jgi:hypothetical protein
MACALVFGDKPQCDTRDDVRDWAACQQQVLPVGLSPILYIMKE